MRIGMSGMAVLFLLATRLHAAGDDKAWQTLDVAASELRAQEAELRICNSALDACREGIAARRTRGLVDLRKAVDEAEKGVTSAQTAAGLDPAREKLQKARTARDEKIEALLANEKVKAARKALADAIAALPMDGDAGAALQKRSSELDAKIAESKAKVAELEKVLVGAGKESLARLDAMFEKFAAESGHPELKGAPVLLGGLSASVLGTRNVACAVPERVFGIVHAAGGNMQEMPDDGRGMIQEQVHPARSDKGEPDPCRLAAEEVTFEAFGSEPSLGASLFRGYFS